MKRARQRGVAAIELALVISATFFVMPAMFLFARVFWQYNVLKQATQDAAFYMASLTPAEMRNPSATFAAATRAKQMLATAVAAAGIPALPANVAITCDGVFDCAGGVVPVTTSAYAKLTLAEDYNLANFTFPWLGGDNFTWPMSKTSIVPYAR